MEFRSWKWMVPGMAAPILLVLQLWINGWAEQAGVPSLYQCAWATVPIMAILAVQAAAGFRAYYKQVEVDQLSMKRKVAGPPPSVQTMCHYPERCASNYYD